MPRVRLDSWPARGQVYRQTGSDLGDWPVGEERDVDAELAAYLTSSFPGCFVQLEEPAMHRAILDHSVSKADQLAAHGLDAKTVGKLEAAGLLSNGAWPTKAQVLAVAGIGRVKATKVMGVVEAARA